MRFIGLVIALLPSTSSFALTPTTVGPAEIFDEIVEKSANRSTGFMFEQSTLMMGMTITGSGEGVYDLPRSRTDLTFKTPIGDIVIRTVSDGETLWQVEQTPLGIKTVRHDLSSTAPDGQGPVDPFMAFAGVETRKFLDAILENFDAEVLGVDESATSSVYVLNLEPKQAGDAPSLRFKIGVEDAFPREMNIFTPEGEPITTIRVTRLDFDVVPDPGRFTYIPGPDDQIVEASKLLERRLESPAGQRDLEGTEAPNFILSALDGREVNLRTFRGQHVLIDFWASWCGPCKRALQHIQTLADSTPGLVVLTINAEPANIARGFVEQNGFSFTTLMDPDQSVSIAYSVTAIPTTFIIAPDGTIAKHMLGYHTEEQLRTALSALGL